MRPVSVKETISQFNTLYLCVMRLDSYNNVAVGAYHAKIITIDSLLKDKK